MARVLLIAEKPSVARDIQAAYNKIKGGYQFSLDITSAAGHLVGLCEPDEYCEDWKKWDLSTLPMIPDSFKKKVLPNSKDVFKKIKDMCDKNHYDYIINACDGDREGEAIFALIYEQLGLKMPVLRFWADDTTEKTIIKALNNLKSGTEMVPLSEAAMLRIYSDWLVGMNFTRAATLALDRKSNIGRVLTPSLAMIVKREKEIQNFKPQPYFELNATFRTAKGENYVGKLVNAEPKLSNKYGFLDKQELEILSKNLSENGIVIEYKSEEKPVKAPTLFNLTDLQKACVKYGFSPAKTSSVAQKLYEKHLLSYPRTESKHVSRAVALELPAVLKHLLDIPELSPFKSQITQQSVKDALSDSRWVNDKKAIDHPALLPTNQPANLSELTEDELKVYMLVAKRLVAIFMPNCIMVSSSITTLCTNNTDKLEFKSNSNAVKSHGWKILYGKDKDEEEKESDDDICSKLLPEVCVNDVVLVQDKDIIEKTTIAPPRYTLSSILSAMESAGKTLDDKELEKVLMESAGLGTVATRAEILTKLEKGNYIEVKAKKIIPTTTGIELIESLKNHPITSAELTAKWEKRLKDVEKGHISFNDFYNSMLDFVRQETKTLSEMKALGMRKDYICQCPKCRRNLYETDRFYFCDGVMIDIGEEKKACDVIFPKKFGKSVLSRADIKDICEKGNKERQIITKDGKKSIVNLVLDNDFKLAFGTKEAVGTCPLCKSRILTGNKVYYCEKWKPDDSSGCGFYIYKTFGKTSISKNVFQDILKNGQSKNEIEAKFPSGKSCKGKICLDIENHRYKLVEYKAYSVCKCLICNSGEIISQRNRFICNNSSCDMSLAKSYLGAVVSDNDMRALIKGEGVAKNLTFKKGTGIKTVKLMPADDGGYKLGW